MKTQILSNEEIASFCLELSLLLHAGVSASDGLALLAEESSAEHKQLLNSLALQIDDGSTLPQALKDSGRFPVYVCGLLEVGEQSGRTEEALSALAQYYEGRVRLDKRIRSALLYPAVMLLLMLLVIAVLLIKVLPIFNDVYTSLGGSLTGVAGMLLSVGQGLDAAMPVLWLLLALLVVFVTVFAVSSSFRSSLTAAWQKSSGDKGLANQINTARLAQALAMGISSGLPLEEALDLASGLVADIPSAQKRCQNCRELLDNGHSLSEALRESKMLPASQCRLLELGQRSGLADSTMNKIAESTAETSEAALEDTISRVEPALVFVCSLLVGLILLSVMLPLMNIMSAIG